MNDRLKTLWKFSDDRIKREKLKDCLTCGSINYAGHCICDRFNEKILDYKTQLNSHLIEKKEQIKKFESTIAEHKINICGETVNSCGVYNKQNNCCCRRHNKINFCGGTGSNIVIKNN